MAATARRMNALTGTALLPPGSSMISVVPARLDLGIEKLAAGQATGKVGCHESVDRLVDLV